MSVSNKQPVLITRITDPLKDFGLKVKASSHQGTRIIGDKFIKRNILLRHAGLHFSRNKSKKVEQQHPVFSRVRFLQDIAKQGYNDAFPRGSKGSKSAMKPETRNRAPAIKIGTLVVRFA